MADFTVNALLVQRCTYNTGLLYNHKSCQVKNPGLIRTGVPDRMSRECLSIYGFPDNLPQSLARELFLRLFDAGTVRSASEREGLREACPRSEASGPIGASGNELEFISMLFYVITNNAAKYLFGGGRLEQDVGRGSNDSIVFLFRAFDRNFCTRSV